MLFSFRHEYPKKNNLEKNGSKTIIWRRIRLSFKLYYSSVVKMKRFFILILVMSWSNLCPLWNYWVFLLMTIWVLMSMFQSCVKAARQTNALRRIVKYTLHECRLNIYQAFISSNSDYCDIVWHFCSNRSTYKIEKVHNNALQVTLN